MKFVGVTDEMLKDMRHGPGWPAMEAIAHTLAYDAAVLGDDRVVPFDRAARVTAQTLVMEGSASQTSMPFMRVTAEQLTQAIPGAQHQTVEGQSHDVDAKIIAPVLTEFFGQKIPG